MAVKRRKSILIIDDDREISRLIEETLEREFGVITASTAEEGLRILKDKPVSLVILDYFLPDMDGVKTLRKIREEFAMPIIMISAHGDKNVVLSSWKYRADFYIDKPFVFRELRDKVGELLNKNQPFGILGLDPASLPADIVRALEYIWENIMNPESGRLGRTSIASATSVSPKYLSTLFNRECGKSIFDCINILRTEKAKELLANQAIAIKDISTRLGFDHPHNFSKFFRKMTGNPPTVYKKQSSSNHR